MKYEQTAQRAAPVVSVADAKSHLVIDHNEDDNLVAMYIEQATAYCQAYTGIQLGSQGYSVYGDTWCEVASLPLYPIDSVVVKYIDTDLIEQTMDSTDYVLDNKVYPAILYPASGTSWPALGAGVNVVTVEAITSDAPLQSQVSAAIYLMTGHLYEHREASSHESLAEIPFGIEAFLDQVRLF